MRHFYFARVLLKNKLISKIIIQKREKFIPDFPKGLNSNLIKLFQKHFEKRDDAEKYFFSNNLLNLDNIDHLIIDKKELCSDRVKEFIISSRSKLCITFGCSLLDKNILNLPVKFWNVHGGLTPQFRGTITHFWPSYFLMPQFTGYTLHEIDNNIDTGNVIHQTSAKLNRGDGLQMLSSRTTKHFIDQFVKILSSDVNFHKIPNGIKQKSIGKTWKNSDWHPCHLNLIYGLFDDKIVDLYLDKKLTETKPKIISIFKKN